MPAKATDVFNQSVWRRIGAVSITIAAVLAVVAVPSGILRDSVIHVVRLSGGHVPNDVTASTTVTLCLLYWLVFLGALFTALYMAFLDIRYIRLQYAIEKQRLFHQSLGDGLIRSASSKKDKH